MEVLRFSHRRGPAAEWAMKNPVLLGGEPGLETDTGKFKYGDGVHSWNELSYFTHEAAITALVQQLVQDAVFEGVEGPPGPPGPPGQDGRDGLDGQDGLDASFESDPEYEGLRVYYGGLPLPDPGTMVNTVYFALPPLVS